MIQLDKVPADSASAQQTCLPQWVRGLFRPVTSASYLLVVLAAMVGAYLYTMREQSIFACPANGYSDDNYLAYCHATHYGDYDHGAFWFGLEPGVRDSVRTAKVLFLGNSRMQFGFSTSATDEWFASNATSYYLMGFAYWENHLFASALLDHIRPTAKVYVINIDTFFDATETAPAQVVMHEGDAALRYQRKQGWQRLHARVCTRAPILCGHDQAFFRSRRTGAYTLVGGHIRNAQISYIESADPRIVRDYTTRAASFLSRLPIDRKCILLTMVPTVKTAAGTAKAIADALGAILIAPQLSDLNTFDESHMDRTSAERWSTAFLNAAGPRIRQCLTEP